MTPEGDPGVALELGPDREVHLTITVDDAGSYWGEFLIHMPQGTLSGATGSPSASALDALAQALHHLEGMSRDPMFVGSRTGEILAALCGRGGQNFGSTLTADDHAHLREVEAAMLADGPRASALLARYYADAGRSGRTPRPIVELHLGFLLGFNKLLLEVTRQTGSE